MVNDWNKITLKDFISIQRGHDLPTSIREDGNIPVMGSFGITGFHNVAKVNGPGVTIGRSGGSMGVTNYIKENYWPLNTVLYVTDFKNNEPYFTYLLLKTIDFSLYNSGSAQQSLNRNFIYGIELNVPPIDEQKAIVDIIGSLDDKIELNRQMSHTLGQMAQALYRSWFVDFDPVIDNALAAGNDIPEPMQKRAKQRSELGDERKPLPENIKVLFPNEFEYSRDLENWVPKEWRVSSISSMCRLDTTSIKPMLSPEKMWMHFSIPAFDDGETAIAEKGSDIKSNKYQVNKDAILVSKLNPETQRVWYPNVVDEASSICSTEFMQFVPKRANIRPFFYFFFKSDYFQSELLSTVTGTTGSRQRAQPKMVQKIQVINPENLIIEKYSQIVNEYLGKIHNISLENKHLAEIRDALIPRLVSGKIVISELVHESNNK